MRTSPAPTPTASSTATSRCWPHDKVRYQGEAVALVAADHPETARRAAALVEVDYDELTPVTDPRTAVTGEGESLHPGGNWCGTCRSGAATPRPPPPSWSPATTRSACRTRRSSAPSPGSRCPPPTVASTSSSRPSGCTSTAARSPTRSASTRTWCGSRWPGSAARSAPARTSRCRCTPRCWRCAPAARSRWSTPARSRSSATCTGTRRGCATSTAPTRTAGSSTCAPRSCWTAAPTPPARRLSSPTRRRWASGPTSYRTSRSTATAPTPTTRRAGRCAASERCRPRSATSRRWTGSPRRSASTPSRSGCATRWPRETRWRPGR